MERLIAYRRASMLIVAIAVLVHAEATSGQSFPQISCTSPNAKPSTLFAEGECFRGTGHDPQRQKKRDDQFYWNDAASVTTDQCDHTDTQGKKTPAIGKAEGALSCSQDSSNGTVTLSWKGHVSATGGYEKNSDCDNNRPWCSARGELGGEARATIPIKLTDIGRCLVITNFTGQTAATNLRFLDTTGREISLVPGTIWKADMFGLGNLELRLSTSAKREEDKPRSVNEYKDSMNLEFRWFPLGTCPTAFPTAGSMDKESLNKMVEESKQPPKAEGGPKLRQ